LTVLLQELERKKLGQADRPRASTAKVRGRHVPAAIRREVWARDGGRCGFVGTQGRCAERGFLEFHHVIPFAEGGLTTVDNLQLRCRAHNAHEAAQHFGPSMFRESSIDFSSVRTELAVCASSSCGDCDYSRRFSLLDD
jgi:HNH endonuclease